MSTSSAGEQVEDDGARSHRTSGEVARLQAELSLAEETIAGLVAQLDGIGRVEEERQAELGQIQMEHRAALEEIRVANVYALGAIEEARQADLGQLQIDHRAALAAAEARRRADLEAQLATQIEAHAMRVVELEAAHAEALGDARRTAEERVATLTQERNEALALLDAADRRAAEAQQRLPEREHQMAASHAQTITAERLVFEQLVSAQQDELAAREQSLAEARAAHARELAAVQARCAELEARRADRGAEDDRAPPSMSWLEPEAPPKRELLSPRRGRSPRVYASIADALQAAASERDDDG